MPPAPAPTPYLSPKVTWPTVALIAVGAVIMVLDLTGVILVEDGLWLAILGSSAAPAGIGYAKSDPADNR